MKASAYRAWPHASRPTEHRYSSSDADDDDDDDVRNAQRPCLTEDEDHISPIDNLDNTISRLYNYLSGSDCEQDANPPMRNRSGVTRAPRSADRDTLGSLDDGHYSRINDTSTLQAPPPPTIPPIPPPPLEELTRPQVPPRYITDQSTGTNPTGYETPSESEFTSRFLQTTPSGSVFVPSAQSAPSTERAILPHPRSAVIPAPVQPLRWTPTPLDHAVDSSGQESNTGTTRTGPSAASSSDRQNVAYHRNASSTGPLPTYHSNNDFRDYGHDMKARFCSRCNWRSVALVLVFLVSLLSVLLIYFAAMKVYHLDWNLQPVHRYGESAILDENDVLTIRLGESASKTIAPHSLWNLQLHLPKAQFILLNTTLPAPSVPSPTSPPPLVGLYGRRATPPTRIRYDFMEILDGSRLPAIDAETSRLQRRSAEPMTSHSQASGHQMSVAEFMEEGTWFIAFYNDNDEPQNVIFTADDYDEQKSSCPSDCHGRGDCQEGQCVCDEGYQGWDCKQRVCPVLCRGNGVYVRGECRCYDNWKGVDCGVPANQCADPGCSGNGLCVEGVCVCTAGYKGELCAEVDCLTPGCSGNGVCNAGLCVCFPGYRGNDCSLPSVSDVDGGGRACIDCSGHGQFDFATRRCRCEEGWTGDSCQRELCSLDCAHGVCMSQRCVCQPGWSGAICDQLRCDARCDAHGFCANGTCVCNVGWNGRHCTLDGCPNACNNHGTCQSFRDGWRCNCHDTWKGLACSIAMETDCSNQKDDDGDGLQDCHDPDCCMSIACKDSTQCRTSADPMEILLRKQPPSSTASFYDRMRFLVEDDSVQSFAQLSSFNHSQVSVIRGKVVSTDGSPLIGVRVAVESQPLYGFTLTRELGLFDLLVNGGGSVTLNLSRHPFVTRQSTVMVPWNRLLTMPAVTMALADEARRPLVSCDTDDGEAIHKWSFVHPVIHSTWQHTQLGACPTRTTVIPESQVLQESVQVCGTSVYLVYHSSETPGYMSTLDMQLTSAPLPPRLVAVRLHITVEGVIFERLFEASERLKYRFAWDRRNAYNQKVYGIVTATVAVGYEYTDCDTVFWEYQSSTMSGYDITSSEIGGWNLHIHHTYNFEEGILHKGDGANIYLKSLPRRVVVIAGDGRRRPSNCRRCNGAPSESPLLAPGALACGRDGSLYIGDFDYVRKVSPDRSRITSILQLSLSSALHKYYMAVSPLDGKLYLSEHESRRILRIKTMGAVQQLSDNAVTVAGGNDRCVPGDDCGDGGPAKNATLTYPKGIAIDKDGHIYLADGANIRVIDSAGTIRMLIGSQGVTKEWHPLDCRKSVRLNKVSLKWPTALAINPLDNTLHFVDDDLVLKVTPDGYVVVIAGIPAYCSKSKATTPTEESKDESSSSSQQQRAVDVALVAVQNIAFASNGDLFIVESDGRRTNRVRVVSTDGMIADVAGVDGGCDCTRKNCSCYDAKQEFAAKMPLAAPTDVAVGPSGVIHVSDALHRRVYAIHSPLPSRQPASAGGAYIVLEGQREHRFNRYGQHIETRDVLTGSLLYAFKYSVNSYYGKLSEVTDGSGSKLTVRRDYSTRATAIVCTADDIHITLSVDSLDQLARVHSPGGASVSFSYGGAGGSLLSSREGTDGRTFLYEYDDNGRLTTVVQPTGERTDVTTDVSGGGAVSRAAGVTMTTRGNSLAMMRGESHTQVSYGPNGGVLAEWPYHLTVALEPSPHPLGTQGGVLALGEYRLHGVRRLLLPRRTAHKLEWKHFLRRDRRRDPPGGEKVGRRMRVNGEPVLTVEYDRSSRTEILRDVSRTQMLRVSYTPAGLPATFTPTAAGLASANATYDAAGRLRHWHHAERHLEFVYDTHGNLTERRVAGAATYVYKYEAGTKPTTVTMADSTEYHLRYDRHSNLKSVVMPSGAVHHFHVRLSFGIYRQLYHPPGAVGAYAQDYSSDGRLQQIRYPSGGRRSTYYYSTTGQPSSVHFDQSDVTFTYYAHSNVLHKIRVADARSSFAVTLTFEPEAALIERHTIQFASSSSLVGAEFRYEYDAGLRLTRITGHIGDKQTDGHKVGYDGVTGQLTRLGGFRFNTAQRVIRDSQAIITREVDALGRTTAVRFRFSNHAVFVLETSYDAHGRIHGWRRKVGAGDIRAFLHSYDDAGRLQQVVMDDRPTWSLEYDANWNLVKLQHHSDVIMMSVNERDQLIQRGPLSYTYDQDGFLVIRATHEKLTHDGRGRLTRFVGRSGITFDCLYDAHGRLVATVGNTTVQYLYADVTERDRVTHTYHHGNSQLTTYLYDNDGRLFAMSRQSKHGDVEEEVFYVALDPLNSPIVVFNARGRVEKQLHFDPLGATISDSAPEFFLPFGYRSGIVLYPSTLLLIEGRVYDPQTGRFTAPSYEQLFGSIVEILMAPEMMNVYQLQPFARPQSEENELMTDIHHWVDALGYDLEALMPSVSFSGTAQTMSSSSAEGSAPTNCLLAVRSAFECAFERDMSNFMRISSVPQSAIVARGAGASSRFVDVVAPDARMFGDGVVLSVDAEGNVGVDLLNSAHESLAQLATVLFNNSLAVGVGFTLSGRDVHHFVRPSVTDAVSDLRELKLTGSEDQVNGVNVSVHRHQRSRTAEPHHIDVRLHARHTSLHMRYGSTVAQERLRVLGEAQRRAISVAWQLEAEAARMGKSTLHTWSREQLEQLKRDGVVSHMDAQLVRDPLSYPELSDDPNNVRFVPR